MATSQKRSVSKIPGNAIPQREKEVSPTNVKIRVSTICEKHGRKVVSKEWKLFFVSILFFLKQKTSNVCAMAKARSDPKECEELRKTVL